MNKKQTFILTLGSILVIVHLILYFPVVHGKYEKLRLERLKLKTDYSQPVLDDIKDKEGTYNRALMAWMAVSVFLICVSGLLLWMCRNNPHKTSPIIICLFSFNVLWLYAIIFKMGAYQVGKY